MEKQRLVSADGVKMNREQIQAEYLRLLSETCKQEDEIMKRAIANGTWMPGLDSNRELFLELDREFQIKIEELKKKLDE